MKYLKSFSLTLVLLSSFQLTVFSATPDARRMKGVVEDGLAFSAKQAMLMYDSVKDIDGRLPNTAKDGKLVTCSSSEWVSGFIPGALWYLYEYTADPAILAAAEDLTDRIAPEQYNTQSHDVGFMVNCSFGNGYRLTGREDYRQVLINAANSLATRFNPEVGCTRSWRPRPDKGWR